MRCRAPVWPSALSGVGVEPRARTPRGWRRTAASDARSHAIDSPRPERHVARQSGSSQRARRPRRPRREDHAEESVRTSSPAILRASPRRPRVERRRRPVRRGAARSLAWSGFARLRCARPLRRTPEKSVKKIELRAAPPPRARSSPPTPARRSTRRQRAPAWGWLDRRRAPCVRRSRRASRHRAVADVQRAPPREVGTAATIGRPRAASRRRRASSALTRLIAPHPEHLFWS